MLLVPKIYPWEAKDYFYIWMYLFIEGKKGGGGQEEEEKLEAKKKAKKRERVGKAKYNGRKEGWLNAIHIDIH